MKLRLAEMTPSLDFYNVMAYDYAGSWSTMSGHQANLRASSRNPKSTPFSTDAAFKYYTKAGGVPSSKLILGIPLYGRAFANTDGPGCPFQGGGTAGSWENGIWDYKDLPQFGAHQELESVFEQGGAGASWSYDPSKRLMISYDTVPMVEEKTRYILDSGFGGAVWWEASGDRREQNSTGTGGSLITTFAEGIRKAGGMLDRSDNVLSYPESRFENLKRGFPDE